MPPVTRRNAHVLVLNPLWDEDEDYDSDVCVRLGWSLEQRARSKLTSLIHAAMVDLDDDEGNWVTESGYEVLGTSPMREDLQNFVVELEEVLVWSRESRRVVESDVDTIVWIFREMRKEGRVIGPRPVRDLLMLVDTWIMYYRYVYDNGLWTEQPARESRASSRASLRAGRHAQTETVTTESLVQRLEDLQASIREAFAVCV